MEWSRPALEHGSSRTGRWLRGRRLQLAVWIAVAEGLLLVLGVVPALAAVGVAALVVVFHLVAGRKLSSYAARQASWVAALSQVLVAAIPVLVLAIGVLALVALVAIAAVALVVVLADRR